MVFVEVTTVRTDTGWAVGHRDPVLKCAIEWVHISERRRWAHMRMGCLGWQIAKHAINNILLANEILDLSTVCNCETGS